MRNATKGPNAPRLGIDVGGTSTKVILFDSKVRRSTVVQTPRNKKDFLKMLKNVVSANWADGIAGIGIGLPGILDFKAGKIVLLPNLVGLNELNVIKFLRQFHANVAMDNDTKCILRAEAAFGAARGKRNVLLVAIGTGIGGGLMVDGKIYYGGSAKASGSAGEIGHLVENGAWFEDIAGGKTMIKFDKAEFKRVSAAVGHQLAGLVNLLNPELIVMAGGLVADHHADFIPQAQAIMRQLVIDPRAKKTPIVLGTIGEPAGAIGAALLV